MRVEANQKNIGPATDLGKALGGGSKILSCGMMQAMCFLEKLINHRGRMKRNKECNPVCLFETTMYSETQLDL